MTTQANQSSQYSLQVSVSDAVHAIEEALADIKAKDVTILDVQKLTDVTDRVIIATGTSRRHVKASAERVAERLREQFGIKPIGTEGEVESEWVLVDFGFAVVHLMLEPTRKFYDLEKLWSGFESDAASVLGAPSR